MRTLLTLFVCMMMATTSACDGGGSGNGGGGEPGKDSSVAGKDQTIVGDISGSDVPGVDTHTPPSCIAIDRVDSKVYPPAAVRVTFRVLDCNGYPVRYLTPADMVVINDEKGEAFGDGGEGGGASAPDVPSEFGFYSILALDMSDSIFNNNALDSVIDGAQIFVQKMVVEPGPELKHHVALLVFGRTDAIQVVLSFTDDAAALHDKLEELRAGESLGTTNLYGAYMKALEEVMDVGKDLELVERSVVILTDGTHEAGAEDELRQEALNAKKDSEDSGTLNVFSIGIKGNYAQEKLEELASKPDYFALADDAASLEDVFQDVAERVEAIAHSNYVVGVCTPVELGTPSLTIQVSVDGAVGDVTVDYPTDELSGDVASCDWDSIAKPCEDYECGPGALPGFTCGTCDACGTECEEGSCTFTTCEGKTCGDDGCGGDCGDCGCGEECQNYSCVFSACEGNACGDDGCGGSCGSCGCGEDCHDGQCLFTACEGKGCGGDGCGGSCGTCDACGTDCLEGACTFTACESKTCGDDGCGGSCGTCGTCGTECLEGACTFTACDGKTCGDDGCGGSCGTCDDCGTVCMEGVCAFTACDGKECGADGCGETCGACDAGWQCNGSQQCFDPCDGKECGENGYGGICGTCDACGTECSEGACVFTACDEKECGDDGCGGSCGVCGCGSECSSGQCLFTACDGKECGSDGCGESCGECNEFGNSFCGDDGLCSCAPDCVGTECGSDGCGGSCGECGPSDACQDGTCILGADVYWTDPETGLQWELQTRHITEVYASFGLEWEEFCAELLLDEGAWRTPTIDELRTLVRGCPATEPGGACNIAVGDCLADGCRNESCFGCPGEEGPDFGLYLPVGVFSSFNVPVFVSVTSATSFEEPWWMVNFSNANVFSGLDPTMMLRCVRDADCVPDCDGAVCGDGGCLDQPEACGECGYGQQCEIGQCIDLPLTWQDPDTGLTWEAFPSQEYFEVMDLEEEFLEVEARCQGLELAGGGWRLPTISELRSLVRGCPNTELGGECPVVHDGCTSAICLVDGSCDGCGSGAGPTGGCYWPASIGGTCNRYVSATHPSSYPMLSILLYFNNGSLEFQSPTALVRCVRGP